MNCCAERRCCNERTGPLSEPRSREAVERVPAGTALTGDPSLVRGESAPGGIGNTELRAISVRTGGTGVPGAPAKPHRALIAGIEVAFGKDAGELRSEASATEGGPSGENATGRHVPRQERECVGIRQSGQRQDTSSVGTRAGADSRRPPCGFHDLRAAGAGSVAGEKRTAAEPSDSQAGILRSAGDRRPGLRATEPGRNGSAVHASGGTLRTRQRTDLIESRLLEMGGNLQGSDDDGGCHRSPRASQRDSRTQYSELSNGAGEEEKGGRVMIAESKRTRTSLNWRLRLQTSGIYRDLAIPGCKVKVKTGGVGG